MKRLALVLVLILALGVVVLARCDIGVGSSVPFVPAPILQATTGRWYGLRWRDSTRTKLMIRRVEPSEWQGQRDWTLAKPVGRIGLLSEYDLIANTVKPLEPEEWLASSEPCVDPAPRPMWPSPPELDIDTRDDLFRVRTPVPNMPHKVTSVGVRGRHYLTYAIVGDRVAIAWCTSRLSRSYLLSGGEDRWGGRLYVEFRSLKHPEKRGPSVRLKWADSEFRPPAIAWMWDGTAILVVDDRNMGFWFVPCPDLSDLEK